MLNFRFSHLFFCFATSLPVSFPMGEMDGQKKAIKTRKTGKNLSQNQKPRMKFDRKYQK